MPCAVVPTAARFASSVIGYTDCQARTIGQAGYQALTMPGGVIPSLLGVLLTILIALVGYRLILGDTPTVREGVLTLVKVGVVLAFATGWSAYRPVVYDVALETPGELAGRIGGASGLPGGTGLAAHLDAVDGQFEQLAIVNANQPTILAQSVQSAPPPFVNFDVFALGSARIAFLGGALASYVAPRLLAGLLLALGPLFVAFLLFDSTRGLVEAWIGVLAGTALASIAVSVVLGVEFGLLEPWLVSLITQRGSGEPIPGVASQLLVTVLVFNAVLLAVSIGAALTTTRLKLVVSRAARDTGVVAGTPRIDQNGQAMSKLRQTVASGERSRASAIAEAAATLHRRENGSAITPGAPAPAGRSPAQWTTASDSGASFVRVAANRRRALPRRSNSATSRDRR